jgi:DNA-binding CsgD family transcriptional regulator
MMHETKPGATKRGALFNRSADDSAPVPDAGYARGAVRQPDSAATEDVPMGELSSLSPSEHRVLEQALRGLSVREIAEHLVVTEATVKTHLTHIYGKLGVRGRLDLLARYRDRRTGPVRRRELSGDDSSAPSGRRLPATTVALPLLVVLVVLVGAVSLMSRPARASLEQITQLIEDGTVAELRLEGSTLVATAPSGERYEVVDVAPEMVRSIATEHRVPFVVTAQRQGPATALVLVVSAAPYGLLFGVLVLGWAIVRRSAKNRGAPAA